MSNYVFIFDLDSTITTEEILPTISKKIGKEKEMRELTEKTMMGDIPFEESFKSRVDILKNISVDEVSDMISNIHLNSKLVKFLNENRERCYIATSNLDVWIIKLMKKLGMEKHFFSSKAEVENDHIVNIKEILSKESVVDKFDYTVAIGDGSNDKLMVESATIGIGFGGVRNISPILLDVIDYAVYAEDELIELLNSLK